MSRLAIFEQAGREIDVWYATYLKPQRRAAANAPDSYLPILGTIPTLCQCGGTFRHQATHRDEVDFICDDCGTLATRRRTS